MRCCAIELVALVLAAGLAAASTLAPLGGTLQPGPILHRTLPPSSPLLSGLGRPRSRCASAELADGGQAGTKGGFERAPAPAGPPPRMRARSFKSRHNIPTDPEDEWEFFYGLLREYYEAHGHTSIPAGPAVNQSLLRNWCADQRKSYMKTLGVLDLGAERANTGVEPLTRERKERLDAAGFYWGHLEPVRNDDELFSLGRHEREYEENEWSARYEELRLYVEDHVDSNVPLSHEGGLGSWVTEKRSKYADLSGKQRELLNELGFDWEWRDGTAGSTPGAGDGGTQAKMKKRRAVMWPERLRQLDAFISEHGHCDVPQDYEAVEGLGAWVKRHRRNKKLSLRSRMQLEERGFRFDFET